MSRLRHDSQFTCNSSVKVFPLFQAKRTGPRCWQTGPKGSAVGFSPLCFLVWKAEQDRHVIGGSLRPPETAVSAPSLLRPARAA
jgi:hypothetical protein